MNKFKNENADILASCSWKKLTHLDLSLNETKLIFVQKLARNPWKDLQ